MEASHIKPTASFPGTRPSRSYQWARIGSLVFAIFFRSNKSDADEWQRFMPADALWTLAMACNVYLTFRHRYSSSQLRGLEWKWLLACYGIPFIPAIIYAFLRTEAKGRIYGPATVSLHIHYPRRVELTGSLV